MSDPARAAASRPRSVTLRASGVAVACLAVALPAHAQGDDPPLDASRPGALDLRWRAPSDCPTQQEIRALVDRQSTGATAAGLSIAEVDVRRGEPWHAHLRLQGAVRGERVFEAASCSELAEAVAFVIALALQQQAMAASEAAPQPSPSAGEREPSASAKFRPGRSARWAGGAGVVVDSAAMPRFAVGATLLARVDWQSLHAVLSVAYLPPVSASLDANDPASAQFQLAVGEIQGCYAVSVRSSRMGPCLAIEAGSLSGRSSGVAEGGASAVAWVAADAGVFAAAPIGPLSVRVDANVLRPLRRPSFVFDGESVVHSVDPWGFRATVAILLPP